MCLAGSHVLIAEDDIVFRELVSDYCETLAMRVSKAGDGVEALDHFVNDRPDVVLIDLGMPRMDGRALLRVLSERAPNVPTIVITANEALEDVVTSLRTGAWDYLMKPLDKLETLKAAMEDCLGDVSEGEGDDNREVSAQAESAFDTLPLDVKADITLIRNDADTAQWVQRQLYPAPEQDFGDLSWAFSLQKTHKVSHFFCDVFEASQHYLCSYLVKIKPINNECALISLLIKSLCQTKAKRYRHGLSNVIIQPQQMLTYLNDQLVKSGLNCQVEIVYLVVHRATGEAAVARMGADVDAIGITETGYGLLPMIESVPMGIAPGVKPEVSMFSILLNQGVALVASNAASERMLVQKKHFGVADAPDDAVCVSVNRG